MKRILGSSGPSAVPSVTFDVEDVIDEDESPDINEDLPALGHTTRLESGTITFVSVQFLASVENCETFP